MTRSTSTFLLSLTLFLGCTPNLKWNSPCDPNSGSYNIEKCQQWINQNPSVDFDGDSFSPEQGDCDELNPFVNPGVPENPQDSIDNNCNGILNEGAPLWQRPVTFVNQVFLSYPADVNGDGIEEIPFATSGGEAGFIYSSGEKYSSLVTSAGFSKAPSVITYPAGATLILLTSDARVLSLGQDLSVRWRTSQLTADVIFAPEAHSSSPFIAVGTNVQTYDGWTGYLYAVELTSGSHQVFWAGGVVSASAVPFKKYAIVPLETGTVNVINVASGGLSSSLSAGQDTITVPPQLLNVNDQYFILVASTNSSLYVFEGENPFNLLSYYSTSASLEFKSCVQTSSESATIFTVSADGKVYALEVSGSGDISLKWNFQMDQGPATSPVHCKFNSGALLLIAGIEGHIYALDPSTGKLFWKLLILTTRPEALVCPEGWEGFAVLAEKNLFLFSPGEPVEGSAQ